MKIYPRGFGNESLFVPPDVQDHDAPWILPGRKKFKMPHPSRHIRQELTTADAEGPEVPAPVNPQEPSNLSDSTGFGPVKPKERIELLDALRGFAILGILFVNWDIAGYLTPVVFPELWDRLGHSLIYILGNGKLWPLFALLFGTGFAIQLDRAEARGVNLIPTYLRRLFFLVLLGCTLGLFVNVLQLPMLARAGLPMLVIGYVLRNQPPKWLLVAAAVTFGIHLFVTVSAYQSRDSSLVGPPEASAADVAAGVEQTRVEFWSGTEAAYSWRFDALQDRVFTFLNHYPGFFKSFLSIWAFANYVGYMLLGIFLWRIDVLRKPARHPLFFRRLLVVSLPIGLLTAVFFNRVWQSWHLTSLGMGAYPGSIMRVLLPLIQTTSSLAMPLAYIAAIALFLQHTVGRRVMSVFLPVGRTALSNYALQALLPALMFGVYTPGVSRMVLGVWQTIGVLLLIAFLQMVLSRIWIRSFRFGPLEWIWRSLTYWRLQPMRLGH